MTENKRHPVRVKGVVLVMVVTMLFVLIVMLMATLTVVGNANKRTVTKFEENQAYYTARSALGVYITGMLEMDEDADLGKTGAEKAAKALSKKFKDAETEGANVFRKKDGTGNYIGDYKDFGGENEIIKGFVYQQELFGYLTPKYKLNGIERGDVLDSPSDDSNWVETEEWDKKKDSEQKYRVTYKAKVPKVNSVTGLSAGDNVGVMATEDVDITVELLRMAYMKSDDTLITDGVLTKEDYTPIGDSTARGTAKIEDVDWTKTYYRLKVTSTAKIKQGTGGVNEGTVSVILEPKVVNSPSAFKNALTTFEETTLPTKGFTVGGASAASPDAVGSGSVYQAQNDSTWTGSYVYRYDTVTTNTGDMTWRLFENDSFVVQKGYIKVGNSIPMYGDGDIDTKDETDADGKKLIDKRPYIYAGGMEVAVGNFNVGLASGSSTYDKSAVDLIIYHDDKFASDHTVYFGGDQSVVKPGKVAYVDTQDGSKHYYGDVYCDGDMYICGKTQFHGNVYCTGNIILIDSNGDSDATNGWKVEKDLKLGGKIYKNDGTELTTANYTMLDTHAPNRTLDDPTLHSYYEETVSCPWGNNWASNIDDEPTISFGGCGYRSDIPVRTVKKITETYRDSAKNIIPADKFLQKQTKQSSMSLEVKNNAKNFNGSTPKITKDFTIGDNTVTLSNVIDPTDPNVATLNSATSFYEMKLNANDFMNDNSTYYIDATNGSLQIQLTGYTDNMGQNLKFVVVGDNDVIFTIADNDTFHGKCSILSYDIYQMLNDSNTVFNLGDPEKVKAAGLTYPSVPKIYYYVGKDAKLEVVNGSNNVAWAGYMYGSQAMFHSNDGVGKTIKFTYNGNPSGSSLTQKCVFLYGSMVFKTIDGGNDMGVAFIDPGDGGNGAPAEGKVLWKRQRYLNR